MVFLLLSAVFKMLCALRKSDGQTVIAFTVSKDNGPFVCPQCREIVVLRVSERHGRHFSHSNTFTCILGASESLEHLRCKTEIFYALEQSPNATNVLLERHLGTVRPDVSAYVRGVPVAIEIQISPLTHQEITYRTQEYQRRGIYVLWLLLWRPELDEPNYSPSSWEKWIHSLYFGQVFYWLRDLTVVSYHFESAFKEVPRAIWRNGSGKRMSAGGYSKRSKRHRTAIRGAVFSLEQDFFPMRRDSWQGRKIMIPQANLFTVRTQRTLPNRHTGNGN